MQMCMILMCRSVEVLLLIPKNVYIHQFEVWTRFAKQLASWNLELNVWTERRARTEPELNFKFSSVVQSSNPCSGLNFGIATSFDLLDCSIGCQNDIKHNGTMMGAENRLMNVQWGVGYKCSTACISWKWFLIGNWKGWECPECMITSWQKLREVWRKSDEESSLGYVLCYSSNLEIVDMVPQWVIKGNRSVPSAQ